MEVCLPLTLPFRLRFAHLGNRRLVALRHIDEHPELAIMRLKEQRRQLRIATAADMSLRAPSWTNIV